mmetsp:Transcript_15448/g.25802  ORF Transcript_15448/g.25802 Transcript_15448/m.25802 type:complete len:241 (+) Transcript_15448:345-1067(+)
MGGPLWTVSADSVGLCKHCSTGGAKPPRVRAHSSTAARRAASLGHAPSAPRRERRLSLSACACSIILLAMRRRSLSRLRLASKSLASLVISCRCSTFSLLPLSFLPSSPPTPTLSLVLIFSRRPPPLLAHPPPSCSACRSSPAERPASFTSLPRLTAFTSMPADSLATTPSETKLKRAVKNVWCRACSDESDLKATVGSSARCTVARSTMQGSTLRIQQRSRTIYSSNKIDETVYPVCTG